MHWEYNPLPQSLIDSKAAQWKKSKLLTTLLLNRGFDNLKQADKFISPKISDFRDPFKFEKMASVVDKILAKKEKNEKICSHRSGGLRTGRLRKGKRGRLRPDQCRQRYRLQHLFEHHPRQSVRQQPRVRRIGQRLRRNGLY